MAFGAITSCFSVEWEFRYLKKQPEIVVKGDPTFWGIRNGEMFIFSTYFDLTETKNVDFSTPNVYETILNGVQTIAHKCK